MSFFLPISFKLNLVNSEGRNEDLFVKVNDDLLSLRALNDFHAITDYFEFKAL